MALSRIINLCVTLIVAVLMITNVVASVVNTKVYFARQMQALAQDSATSLGLTISQAAANEDTATLAVMVDAIFDSGYYRSIVYTDVHGKTVVSRLASSRVDGVPEWFVSFVDIDDVFGRAEVVSGWFQLGKVYVTANAGLAYQELWRVFQFQLVLFVVVLCLAYLLSGVVLMWSLKSLTALVGYAQSISEGFPVPILKLPFVRELKSLTIAMNEMNQKIQSMLDEEVARANKFQRELAQDTLTGLPTRQDFIQKVSAWVADVPATTSGALVLIRLLGLSELNAREGRDTADQLLEGFAAKLQEVSKEWLPVWLGRCNGSEFSVYIPGIMRRDVENIAQQFFSQLKPMVVSEGVNIRFGVVFGGGRLAVETMLTGADEALRRADSLIADWHVTDLTEAAVPPVPAKSWRARLQNVIDNATLELHYQPVVNLSQQIESYEVFARVREDGNLHNAAAFWSLAQRFGLATSLDKLVIQRVFCDCVPDISVALSINLSPESILDVKFLAWLESFCRDVGAARPSVCFEVSADSVNFDDERFQEFLRVCEAVGATISLQNFGLTPVSLAVLQRYSFASVKLDGSFSAKVIADSGVKFYVESLLQIVNKCGVKMVATSIANEPQWQQFKAIGVHAGQGFYLGEPRVNVND